jgi:hypothetical protein
LGRRSRQRLSAEERNEQVRAELEPLAEGERPGAVTAGAIVSALLALGNLVLVVAGYELREGGGGPAGGVLFALILSAMAAGMWQAKYWAVLGFQAMLVLTALSAAIALMVASNIAAVAVSIAVLAGSGVLFYKMIRAMARIQMPERPHR